MIATEISQTAQVFARFTKNHVAWGRVVLVCEHGSTVVAGPAGDLDPRHAPTPVIPTTRSFPPVDSGQPWSTEFGGLLNADPAPPYAIHATAQTQTGLNSAQDERHSAANAVTHTFRLSATPYGLPHAMPELCRDLIATPAAEIAMAESLAPVLNMGIVEIQKQAKAG